MVLSYKVKILVFILLGISFSEAAALDSLRTEKDGDHYYVVHRVEKGETLYSLSRRYNAELEAIRKANGIVNNELSLAQELRIPIAVVDPVVDKTDSVAPASYHTVATGETLFALSRKYGVTVQELRQWNNLTTDEISVGQQLKVSAGPAQEKLAEVEAKTVGVAENTGETASLPESEPKKPEVPEGFTVYYVQSGDLLGSIARKFDVRPDSIVIWNDLQNTYLAIGQKLLIRGDVNPATQREDATLITTPYSVRRKVTDPSGFTRIYEEGVASKIDSSVETDKYLALHRTLPMGTLVEIRNLMNNQKVFARVVGKLPETGLNEKVLVRLTPVCFERLGIIDPKARVEVSYYEE